MSYERRYASCKIERRGTRGPNDASGAAFVPYSTILGGLLVEEWHASLGIATVSGNVDTWTGQVRGIVLQAPGAAQRPAYVADGANFRGSSVVQCAVTGGKCLQQLTAISPAVFLSGTRPWIGTVSRMRANAAGAAVIFVALDSPVTQILGGFTTNTGTTLTSQFSSSAAIATNNSTSVRLLESSLDSSGVNVLEENGIQIATNGASILLAAAAQALTLGANSAGAAVNDVSAALILLCSARPSPAQRAAVLASARAEWGF
jgi:hypothetical protein